MAEKTSTTPASEPSRTEQGPGYGLGAVNAPDPGKDPATPAATNLQGDKVQDPQPDWDEQSKKATALRAKLEGTPK